MKCIRCGRETKPTHMVGGYAIGPECFKKMFPAEERRAITQSVAERDDRTIDWLDQMKDEK